MRLTAWLCVRPTSDSDVAAAVTSTNYDTGGPQPLIDEMIDPMLLLAGPRLAVCRVIADSKLCR